MLIFKILRWLTFIVVYVIYGLTIWEIIDIQSGFAIAPSYLLENIWNGVTIGLFTILVLIFSISIIRLQIKKLFRATFWGDDNFYYDLCKIVSKKRKISWDVFVGVMMFIIAVLFGILTYFNYFRVVVVERKPVMHFWMMYVIVLYCLFTIKDSCKIKIKNMDDIRKSKFS